jgi:hypothetical protein
MPADRPPADRWRRYRERVRRHQMVPVMPAIGETELNFLIDTQGLPEALAHDRHAVGEAIGRALDSAVRDWLQHRCR